MSRFDRAWDNPINWSFGVGRLFGIRIRVHLFFVLGAVVFIYMQLPKEGAGGGPSLGTALIDGLGMYAILFLLVLLHELGHCFGARIVGGEADEILMWPLGGLASVNPPHEPAAHMTTTVAGPMVNLTLCAVTSVALVLWLGSLGAVPWNPLHPTWPVDRLLEPTTAQIWLLRFFGLNYVLLMFNLLPIFPLDGGRMVQAWLWTKKGYEPAMLIATATGMVGSIVLALFALFTGADFLLLGIAAFGYLTCHNTRRQIKEQGLTESGSFGYDFSQGYTSLQREEGEQAKGPGYFERRRLARAARKREQADQQAKDLARQVEDVLRKVAISGIKSLTAREKRILEQETERQRAGRDDPGEPGNS